MANSGAFSPGPVAQLFASGGDGDRVMALGLMRGNPSLVSVDLAAEVIRRPRSSFEQYQALRVCQDIAERAGVSDHDHAAIVGAIETARTVGTLVSGADRSRELVAARIEAALTRERDLPAG